MIFSLHKLCLVARLAPFASLALTACSYNGLGTSSSAVIETSSTVVHELHGRGLHFATLQGNVILSLGTYHEVLVFDGTCLDQQKIDLNRKSLIESQTLAASITDTRGLEIAFGRRWNGLTIGRHQAAVLAEFSQDDQIARSLHLDLQDLSVTRVALLDETLCKKETQT
ncbi:MULTISPECIES: hypothetical protein [unclassified Ruegeria]|uniref:hypothetical protein n=1 Tax=unclassified Ruegeria TaxID=2625375 RepID=UPI001488EE87|nr:MULTISPECIES: hypothetical protein [unclassified Ruegeria]NOD77376.1 hypothetical protein [Ruegeria sp. HKCCD4332]NOD87799.1 hypothetical protein [Ruegeria sp. HKCCD4318]NOE14169.1 hypothetical protein [Ruegeria sp. HKCCD4318-2]NOG08474.1 hypothetical protein [Ruegeria sp. HKCCD4315]